MMKSQPSLYEQDFALWSEKMADLIAAKRFEDLDIDNLVEEIRDLSKRERDRLLSSVRLILHHLLKWDHQPGSVEIEIDTVQESYLKHDFYVYGFPDGHGETGLETTGEMLCENIANKRIQIEGKKDQGVSIRPGYSGAPVWDLTIGGVRGMAVASVKEEDEALETQKVKIGFMIPADRLNPAVKVIQLFELLFPHEKQLENHWKDAYNWAEPVGSSIGGTDTSLKTWQEAIVQLFQLPTAGIKFVAYLIVVLQDLERSYLLLEQWFRTQVSEQDYPSQINSAREKYSALKASKAQKVQTQSSHLLFWVESDLNQSDYTVKAYFIPDSSDYDAEAPSGFKPLGTGEDFAKQFHSDRFSKEQVKQVLQDCLKRVGKVCETELRIDIFLTESDCNWEVDLWEVVQNGSTLIGCKYDLVLRLENRWKTHSAFIGDWRKRWNYITEKEEVRWICGDGKKRRKILQAFAELDHQDQYAAGLVFSEEQPSVTAFQAALEAGVPLILCASSPSLVRRSKPVVSRSRRPTGKTRSDTLSLRRSMTVFRPRSS